MTLPNPGILLVAAVLSAAPVAPPRAQGDSAREALNIGRTHDQALYDAFSAGYRLTPSGIVDSIEVITEFRRAVLIVRERAMQGEYSFTTHDLAAAMTPFRGLVTFIADVRLHPLNTFAGPPAYDLYVRTGPDTKPVAAPKIMRDPVYPPGSGPGSAMTSIRLEASFPRAEIAGASEPMLILNDERGNVIWQTRLDLARFR